MVIRLRPDRPFGKQIVRFASEELAIATETLTRKPDGTNKAVHEARRAFKRVRGLCRLVEAAEPEFFKTVRKDVGDLGRRLSMLRDATALVESCEKQMVFALRDDVALAYQFLHEDLSRHRDAVSGDAARLETVIDPVLARCRALQQQFQDLKIDMDPVKAAKVIGKGWRKTLEGGCRALALCETADNPDDFHSLRKAAQAHVQQIALLMELWPAMLADRLIQVKAVSDLLGEDHDLCLLLQRISTIEDHRNERYVLEKSIRERQEILRQKALAQARLIFAGDPHFEADRIELLWRHDAKAALA